MSDVTVSLKWTDGLSFSGVNAGGHEIIFDGERRSGASPVEILLEALGACTAIDVKMILEKMQTPATRLEVILDGDRNNAEPRYFRAVRVRFDVWGEGISSDKLARAIKLSFDKYCSVYHSLRSDLQVSKEYRIHRPESEAVGEYLLVE